MSKTLEEVYNEYMHLEHKGTPHQGPTPHSGRYKYGSGENPYQRAKTWQDTVAKYRREGLNDTEIAYKLGVSTSDFRARNSAASQEVRRERMSMIQILSDKGMTPTEISRDTGIPEATVRMNLDKKVQYNLTRMEGIKTDLTKLVDKHEYIDIGKGAAENMGVTPNQLKRAVDQLKETGEFHTHSVYVKSITNDQHWVEHKVLTRDPDKLSASHNRDKITAINVYKDDGVTKLGLKPIEHLSGKKVHIRYDEDGGTDKDGVIQIRPGAKGLDLGNAKYAQVRISVDGTHYLKGMATYGDPKEFPKGTDVIYNTNKQRGTPPEKVYKPLKKKHDSDEVDWDNPFGATIKANGQKGYINKVNEEGDWNSWSRTLSSQFLSKQPTGLVRERINDTYSRLQKEYDELNSLTNPVVKKALMQDFVDGLDTKRQSLKLVGISGMRGHVLLPVSGMKANEIYAPNYKDGDKVVLVRYPHGGIFELPELTVNNKLGKGVAKFMQNAKDAVGIDSSVAQKLSGADFDGDTVMVIPNNAGKIKTARSLRELKNFDPKEYYSPDENVIKRDADGNWPIKQKQMGQVSNLITDMTLKNASDSEIARAVKHSMVVIDTEKHNLDYKRSERENGINELRKKYMTHIDVIDGKEKGGASTLISRSKTKIRIRKEDIEADPELKDIVTNGNPRAKIKNVTQVPVVNLVKDAKKLGSGTTIENMYGDYVNALTKMRDKGRDDISKIPNMTISKEAKLKYKDQVNSLLSKYEEAVKNAPRERQAQLIAEKTIAEKRDPNMQPDQLKKLKQQALASARVQTGANGKDSRIIIDDDEWEAIQSGAISTDRLNKILQYSDTDRVRKLATPRQNDTVPMSKVSRIKSMLNKGYSYSEIAEATGVSVSTIHTITN